MSKVAQRADISANKHWVEGEEGSSGRGDTARPPPREGLELTPDPIVPESDG